MISLQYADQKNADGNSHLAMTSHTFRTYLCIKPKQTSTRRDREKHTTGITIRTATDSQERVLRHGRTIWPGGRQYRWAGDAATQLLCIAAVCAYQMMSYDRKYVHKQQTSRTPRVKTPVNRIYTVNSSVATSTYGGELAINVSVQ